MLQEVGIFWDHSIDGCHIPEGLSTERVVSRFRNFASTFGVVTSFKVYLGAFPEQHYPVVWAFVSELQQFGLTALHSESDRTCLGTMLADVFSFAMDNSRKAITIIITGDSFFSYGVSMLHWRGQKIVVMNPHGGDSFPCQGWKKCSWYLDVLQVGSSNPFATEPGTMEVLTSTELNGDPIQNAPSLRRASPPPPCDVLRLHKPGSVTTTSTSIRAHHARDVVPPETDLDPIPNPNRPQPLRPQSSTSTSFSIISSQTDTEFDHIGDGVDNSRSPGSDGVLVEGDGAPLVGPSTRPTVETEVPLAVGQEALNPDPINSQRVVTPPSHVSSSHDPVRALAADEHLHTCSDPIHQQTPLSQPQPEPYLLPPVALPFNRKRTPPRKFSPLIRVLGQHDGGSGEVRYEGIEQQVQLYEPQAYPNVGATTLDEYLALAERANVVVIGGTGPDRWVKLNPESYHLLGVLETHLRRGKSKVLQTVLETELQETYPGYYATGSPLTEAGSFGQYVKLAIDARLVKIHKKKKCIYIPNF